MERFLYHLAQFPLSERFVLKAALLLTASRGASLAANHVL
jgi:hypothetical protein